MTTLARRLGTLGAALLAASLPVVVPAQKPTKLMLGMGIEQRLGAEVPKDARFVDETGAARTFGSVLRGRPVLVVPVPMRRKAGCGIVLDGLETTLYRANHPNDHKLVKREGANLLEVGRAFDVVVLSLDPRETPVDAADAKNEFEKKLDADLEPVTFLTGDLANIHKVTDALGFQYLYDPGRNVLNNATGSVLLTPDGRISSYTIGKDFQTMVMESNLETARAGKVGEKADDSQMLACIQPDKTVLARRATIESVYTGAALVTLATVILWIASMLRSERNRNRDLGGQPDGA